MFIKRNDPYLFDFIIMNKLPKRFFIRSKEDIPTFERIIHNYKQNTEHAIRKNNLARAGELNNIRSKIIRYNITRYHTFKGTKSLGECEPTIYSKWLVDPNIRITPGQRYRIAMCAGCKDRREVFIHKNDTLLWRKGQIACYNTRAAQKNRR